MHSLCHIPPFLNVLFFDNDSKCLARVCFDSLRLALSGEQDVDKL